MKTMMKLLLVLSFLHCGIFIHDVSGEPPSDPPPPPGGHGGGSNGGPAGAPIDGGLGILFVLGSAFSGFKLYKSRKEEKEST
jgi:hypothetical protein